MKSLLAGILGAISLAALASTASAETTLTIATVNNGHMIEMEKLSKNFEAANPDIDTYLGLSHFDFDQSPIRRYRVIVPFLAAGLHSILHPVLSVIQPNSFPGPDFGMGFCFLVVNNLIMAGAFLLVFKTARFKV